VHARAETHQVCMTTACYRTCSGPPAAAPSNPCACRGGRAKWSCRCEHLCCEFAGCRQAVEGLLHRCFLDSFDCQIISHADCGGAGGQRRSTLSSLDTAGGLARIRPVAHLR
jgi:hypothetical protein